MKTKRFSSIFVLVVMALLVGTLGQAFGLSRVSAEGPGNRNDWDLITEEVYPVVNAQHPQGGWIVTTNLNGDWGVFWLHEDGSRETLMDVDGMDEIFGAVSPAGKYLVVITMATNVAYTVDDTDKPKSLLVKNLYTGEILPVEDGRDDASELMGDLMWFSDQQFGYARYPYRNSFVPSVCTMGDLITCEAIPGVSLDFYSFWIGYDGEAAVFGYNGQNQSYAIVTRPHEALLINLAIWVDVFTQTADGFVGYYYDPMAGMSQINFDANGSFVMEQFVHYAGQPLKVFSDGTVVIALEGNDTVILDPKTGENRQLEDSFPAEIAYRVNPCLKWEVPGYSEHEVEQGCIALLSALHAPITVPVELPEVPQLKRFGKMVAPKK